MSHKWWSWPLALTMSVLLTARGATGQELRTEVVSVLRGEEGDGFYIESRVMARWNNWWVVRAYGGADVSLYDVDSGNLVRYLGGKGRGPMEWASPIDAEVVGDSLYVLDPMAARMTVIGPDLDLVRTFVFTAVPSYDFDLVGSRIAVAAVMFDRGRAGRALFFTDPVSDAPVTQGVDEFDVVPIEGDLRGRRALAVLDGNVTTLDTDRTLRTFDTSGRLLAEVTLPKPPGWTISFLDRRFLEDQASGELQPSWGTSVARAGDLLLVGMNIPAADWRDHLLRHPEVDGVYLERHNGYRGVIELVDPMTGAIHGRATISGYLLAVLKGGYIVSSRKDDLGLQTITIRRLSD